MTGDSHTSDQRRRRRFRAQAWTLGVLALAIYVGYIAFMVVKGTGAI